MIKFFPTNPAIVMNVIAINNDLLAVNASGALFNVLGAIQIAGGLKNRELRGGECKRGLKQLRSVNIRKMQQLKRNIGL